MPKKWKYLIINLLLIFFCSNTFAQYENFQTKLDNYDNLINDFDNSDNVSISELILLSKKIKVREDFISTLQNEINGYNIRIQSIELSIKKINLDLEQAKYQYSKLLIYTYFNRTRYSLLMYILSAESFSQAYLRFKYLKILSRYIKIQAQSIILYKTELEYQEKILKKEKNIRQIFKDTYKTQKLFLTRENNKKLNSLKKMKHKADDIRINIEKFKTERELLFSTIKTYISEKDETLNNVSFKDITKRFKLNKGKLPMPISNAVIMSSFGEHNHPVLNDITIKNDGIDITSKTDKNIKIIFEGVVSNIILIPGNNFSVLIKHGDYFTVYSNVTNIQVSAKEKVSQGQIIGTIGQTENSNLQILNFQIWHLTEKKNPKNWLKKSP